jgi:hypothetical protein
MFSGMKTMFSGLVHHVPEGRAPCSRGLKPCYGVSSPMFREAETMFSEGAHHVPGDRDELTQRRGGAEAQPAQRHVDKGRLF